MIIKYFKASFYIFILIALSLLSAFRGNFPDTQGYVDIYYYFSHDFPVNPINYFINTNFEWFYGIISWILNCFHLSHVVYFFVINFFMLFFLYGASKRFGINFNLVIVYYIGSYYLMYNFSFIRMGLGVTFSFWYASFLFNKQRLGIGYYIYGLILSLCFHLSAAGVLLLLYIGNEIRDIFYTSKYFRYYLNIILVTFVFCRVFLLYVPVAYLPKVGFYLENEEFGVYQNFSSLENFKALAISLLFLFFIRKKSVSNSVAFLFTVFLIGVGVRFGCFDFGVVSSRFGAALCFSEIFLFPIIIRSYFKNLGLQMVIALIYVILLRFFAQTSSFDQIILWQNEKLLVP